MQYPHPFATSNAAREALHLCLLGWRAEAAAALTGPGVDLNEIAEAAELLHDMARKAQLQQQSRLALLGEEVDHAGQ